MRRESVSDELEETIELLLFPQPSIPCGGRPRVPDRSALAGFVYVLKSGIPWETLSK